MAINKNIICQWLKEEDVDIAEGDNQDTEWLLHGNYGGLKIAVGKPLQKDYIAISRAINISDNHQKLMKNIPKKDKQKFEYQLKRDLLLCNVDYQLVFEDSDEDKQLIQVMMGSKVFEDNITKDIFIEKIFKVHRASLLLLTEVKYLEEVYE